MAILFQFGKIFRDTIDDNFYAKVPEGCPVEDSHFINSIVYHALVEHTDGFVNQVFRDKNENGIRYGKIDSVFLAKLRALAEIPPFDEAKYNMLYPDLSGFLEVAEWCHANLDDPYWVVMP